MNTSEFDDFREKMKRGLSKDFGVENVCPFWGNQNAKIVHISQAPSVSVIKNNKPFSDKSGERLRTKWYEISDDVFYNPDNFYFTAVGMYFPGKDKRGGDKKPSFKVAEKWLKKELSFLDPDLFIVVGGVAAKFFFPGVKMQTLVFNDQTLQNKLSFVLPHPSPINIKWYKDNPDFEKIRIKEIRRQIQQTL